MFFARSYLNIEAISFSDVHSPSRFGLIFCGFVASLQVLESRRMNCLGLCSALRQSMKDTLLKLAWSGVERRKQIREESDPLESRVIASVLFPV